MLKGKIIKTSILMVFCILGILSFSSCSEAHILVIGDSKSDYPLALQETQALANVLKSRGYNVLELYQGNANTKNIIKGMYDADAIIYAGHGGYQTGNYNNNGGAATAPFALVGSNDFIWGIGDQMREGWSSNLFTAPFKPQIPVILLHACFSTGWVEDNEVSNPIPTIYSFSEMFTGAGANYYATAWNGAEIVYDFLNGAKDFQEANQGNYEVLTKSTLYNGVSIWKNDHGYAAFVGNWSGKFPSVLSTTAYDDAAAEVWYNSNRQRDELRCLFSVNPSTQYVNQAITFLENSYDIDGQITSYYWDFGDGINQTFSTPVNPTHTYTQIGNYQVTHNVTDNQSRSSQTIKSISITNPPTPPAPTPVYSPPSPSPPVVASTTTYIYKWVKKGKKWYRVKVAVKKKVVKKVTKRVVIKKKIVARKKIVRRRR
ncbi:MAG TPA: PKD domain-containing protein [Methanobacteriaceae archaeon]|nr:PKD domain-containing protein [Methanobacteriaceae archaeon]